MSNKQHENLDRLIQAEQARIMARADPADKQMVAALAALADGDLKQAIQHLKDITEAGNVQYKMSRSYPYRPYDGAAAFLRTMERVFGHEGVGQVRKTLFGEEEPEYRSAHISPTESIQVPWRLVKFGDIIFDVDYTYPDNDANDDSGPIFELTAKAPRKQQPKIDEFFATLEEELRLRSIYRGKAIDGQEFPEFIVTDSVDPSRVVYSRKAAADLESSLWSVIRNADKLREVGVPLKRAILVEGPYGTGKTLAGAITAQTAVANGWTFILVRSGQDNPFQALRTAQLYAPAVVWIEDLDMLSAGKSRKQLTRLLDVLDGIQAKGGEVMCGFTTNFVHVIDRGLLRPGRIDEVIHVGAPDPDHYEKIVRATAPVSWLSDAIDFTKVGEAMTGFMPAFAVNTVYKALITAIAAGETELTTSDLVVAAGSLKRQQDLVEGAREADHAQPTMEGIITDRVTEVLRRASFGGRRMQILPDPESDD